MENHFGKGVMAGLKATQAGNAHSVSRFCLDYRRGFVVGYAHRLSERTGDDLSAAWEAGVLTRRYNLDSELLIDFFREMERAPRSVERCFLAGYQNGY